MNNGTPPDFPFFPSFVSCPETERVFLRFYILICLKANRQKIILSNKVLAEKKKSKISFLWFRVNFSEFFLWFCKQEISAFRKTSNLRKLICRNSNFQLFKRGPCTHALSVLTYFCQGSRSFTLKNRENLLFPIHTIINTFCTV